MFRIWRWSQLQRGGHNGQETTHAKESKNVSGQDHTDFGYSEEFVS